MMPTLLRLLGAVVAIALLVRWLRRRQPDQGVFDEAVANPDLWDSMNQHFEQRDRELEQAKHWSEGEIGLALEQYVFKLKHSDEDHEEWLQKLAQQPKKAARQALEVLGNPDMQSRLRKEPRGEPALFRAVQLLMLAPGKETPKQVRRLLTVSDEHVRREAVQWLAQVADGTCVDDLLEGLGDDELRWPVLNGLSLGKHAPSSRIAIDMFQPLATLLTTKVDDDDYEIATELLLGWDRERALAHLEDRGILDPRSGAFRYALTAMLSAGIWLPREQLHALWHTIEQDDGSKFDAAPVLRMLASHKNVADLALLHSIFERAHPTSEAAATALLTFHGLQDWSKHVGDLPPEQRSKVQQQAMAVFHYDSNVRCGGHQQYFFNATAHTWPTALAGLESIGDTARLEILREAIARFPEPPASDRDSRQLQLAALARHSDAPFADLDTRYNAVPNPAEVTLTRLVLQSTNL